MAEVKYSDPNMYAEGVLAYREQFNLVPNRGFRADIAVTVKTYDDLKIWTSLLASWGYMKNGKWKPRNPLDVKGLLTCFEAKVRERERLAETNSNNETASIPTRGREGVSERSDGDMRDMRSEPPSIYFRTRHLVR